MVDTVENARVPAEPGPLDVVSLDIASPDRGWAESGPDAEGVDGWHAVAVLAPDAAAVLHALEEAGTRPVALMDAVRCGALDGRDAPAVLAAVAAEVGALARSAGVPVVDHRLVLDAANEGAAGLTVLGVGVRQGARPDAPAVAPGCAAPATGAARPDWIDRVHADRAEDLPRAASGAELAEQVTAVLSAPTLADHAWYTEQFDHAIGGDTVVSRTGGAGVVRVDEGGPAVALTLAGNPRACLLNPYLGAQLALTEAHRAVAATGARPVAALGRLTVGPGADPDVAWQVEESRLGWADAAPALGLDSSLATVDHVDAPAGKIHPSPVAAVLGVLERPEERLTPAFHHPGDAVVLLGETSEELSGSAWAEVVHRHLGGLPPRPGLDREQALADVLTASAQRRLVTAACSLGAGGLAHALVTAALRGRVGVALTLPEGDPTVHLFSESAARALVAVSAHHYDALRALCADAGVPLTRLGEVLPDPVLEVVGQFSLDLDTVGARRAARPQEAIR
ncbi:MAG: AIR synthase-related protein [Propionibacteriaceae bacterium]|nr:AIR synthase-related protein [Propionibacteriaceae bacterium]